MPLNDVRNPIFASRPAAPSRLADGVTEAIAAALVNGHIAPGEALPPESEIAREFGVSKPIAREALRQLTNAGLISTQQGKVARAKALNGEPMARIFGYAVRSSLKRLQEANEMRRVVETGIARLAAERRNAEGVETMRQALIDMERGIGSSADFTEADILFHRGMAMATGNSMIQMQMEGLGSVQREVSELFSQRANRTAADWQATVQRHRNILESIAGGELALAEQRIREHFDAADIASLEVVENLGASGA